MQTSRRITRLRERDKVAAKSQAAVASKAIGYIRVSGDEQAKHGYGLEAQERAIRAFAESQAYELVDVVADPAVSGATKPSERAGFGQVLKRAGTGDFSILLVWKFDRLARQIVFAVTAVNDLSEQYRVTIRSVTEPVDTSTPMGRTIFAVLAGMAEQERQAITERTFSGRREKAVRGGFAGGATPYGYRSQGDGVLVVDEGEAAVIQRMFALRADGSPYEHIAKKLNEEGVRTRHGKIWRGAGIAYILDNPKYRGAVEYLFRWGGADAHVLREGQHVAIAPSEQI